MEQIPVSKPLGKIVLEINLDTSQYNVGFSNMNTHKLMQQNEVMTLMSPFHIICIISELRRRQGLAETKIIQATPFDLGILDKNKKSQ